MTVDNEQHVAAIRRQPEYWANVRGLRLILLFPVVVGLVYAVTDKFDLVRDLDHWSLPIGGSIVLTANLEMFMWFVTLTKLRNKLGLPHEAHPAEDLTLYVQDVLSLRGRDV